MKRSAPFSQINRVPVVFGRQTICDTIRFLQLCEVAPVYPLTSVFVSSSGHEQIRLTTTAIMNGAPEWNAEAWPNREELFLNIYTHLLANMVSFHVAGRWLGSDSCWMADRATASKGAAEAEASRANSVPHVGGFTLLGRYTVRLTSAPSGRLEIGA